MTTFLRILNYYLPGIDITNPAHALPNNRNTYINNDFVKYGFFNSLSYFIEMYPLLLKKNGESITSKKNKEYLKKNNKFLILKNNILDNIFVTKDKKNEIVFLFYKTQKLYRALCRFAYICKYKCAKKYDTSTDLCMNELSVFKKNQTLELYENNMLYHFRITDIINIIHNALSHSPNFFPEPLKIKNPYTNIPFSKSNLYNIYFAIDKSPFKIPVLYEEFFANQFNLKQFTKYNEHLIREVSIKNFCKNALLEQRLYYLYRMMEKYYRITQKIKINKDFPSKKIVEVFEHFNFLKLFLYSEYSLIVTKKLDNKKLLKKTLKKFIRLNPMFGQKYIIKKYIRDVSGKYIRLKNEHVKNSDTIPNNVTYYPDKGIYFYDKIIECENLNSTPRRRRERQRRRNLEQNRIRLQQHLIPSPYLFTNNTPNNTDISANTNVNNDHTDISANNTDIEPLTTEPTNQIVFDSEQWDAFNTFGIQFHNQRNYDMSVELSDNEDDITTEEEELYEHESENVINDQDLFDEIANALEEQEEYSDDDIML